MISSTDGQRCCVSLARPCKDRQTCRSKIST